MGQELALEGAMLAIVGAGLPRPGPISSIEPILTPGLLGPGSPCRAGKEEMDPSELLGMLSQKTALCSYTYQRCVHTHTHIYIMCVFSQNPHDRHSFLEVSLKFAIKVCNNTLCVATLHSERSD